MNTINMDCDKVKIDVETVKKMTDGIKSSLTYGDVKQYNEDVKMDIGKIVSEGYEVVMECVDGLAHKWDFAHVKGFDMECVFNEFGLFISHCVRNMDSDVELRLSYYGFGLDRPFVVVFSSNKNDKKAINLLGYDNFSLMLARTMFQEMINKIVDFAKGVVNPKTQKK